MSEADRIAPSDALQDEELDQVAGGTTFGAVFAAHAPIPPLDPSATPPALPTPTLRTAVPPTPVFQVGAFGYVTPPGAPGQQSPVKPPAVPLTFIR